MAGNNVIQFPAGNGGRTNFVSGMGAAPASAAQVPPQAGAPVQQPPQVDQIIARLGTTLSLARTATLKLVGKAVPGTIEQGLFNQFGILQNTLAQLGARTAQQASSDDLAAIGADLEGVEKATNEYVAAVDTALANAPQVEVPASDNKKLWILGGLVGLGVVGTTAYFVLRKPSRRKRIAGLIGLGGTAAAASSERRPRRKARKKLKK